MTWSRGTQGVSAKRNPNKTRKTKKRIATKIARKAASTKKRG